MLRDYQAQHKADIYAAWQQPGVRNVMGVIPAGGGKTVIFCTIVREFNAPACVVAHRQELVSQASLSLNREKVPHGIIAPKEVIAQTVRLHMDTHGETFYSARAPVRVAGVDTLVARGGDKDPWFRQVDLVVQDEGHHVLAANKWGESMSLFPGARGFFPTAHGVRADGKGLGREYDGLADVMVQGPCPRDLINRGFLCDYRIMCPPSDIELTDADIGSTGDYKQVNMRAAVHKSRQLVGDVVNHYVNFAGGKLGLTFAADIEEAKKISEAYNKRNVRAEIITGETPISVRAQLMRKFRARDILQLVSVDVLGEGTDVPAVEVVSMARPTASFQLFGQTFWRGGRVSVSPELYGRWGTFTDDERKAHIAASDKPKFMVFDHVGNIAKHSTDDAPLPCVRRAYSLTRREKRARQSKPDAIPLRTCLAPDCLQPYERFLLRCPYCGATPTPAGRTAPELVDGDLIELDVATLAALRREVSQAMAAPLIPDGAGFEVIGSIKKHWDNRQHALKALKDALQLWGGWQIYAKGRSEREAQKLFYIRFGIDYMTAQTLNKADTDELLGRINADLLKNNVRQV